MVGKSGPLLLALISLLNHSNLKVSLSIFLEKVRSIY